MDVQAFKVMGKPDQEGESLVACDRREENMHFQCHKAAKELAFIFTVLRYFRLGLVMDAFNPSTWETEAETGGSL